MIQKLFLLFWVPSKNIFFSMHVKKEKPIYCCLHVFLAVSTAFSCDGFFEKLRFSASLLQDLCDPGNRAAILRSVEVESRACPKWWENGHYKKTRSHHLQHFYDIIVTSRIQSNKNIQELYTKDTCLVCILKPFKNHEKYTIHCILYVVHLFS